MLASVTDVEVELHVPQDKPTFFGVTWAQDPRDHKVLKGRVELSFSFHLCRIRT